MRKLPFFPDKGVYELIGYTNYQQLHGMNVGEEEPEN